MSEEISEAEVLRGSINCGGIQLDLDKLTFSLNCIYCDLELDSIKEFAYHFQEHLVMSDAENKLLLKNAEINKAVTPNIATLEEEIAHTPSTMEHTSPKPNENKVNFEIEMLEDGTEDNNEILNSNDSVEPHFVYQLMGNEIVTQLNKGQHEEEQATVDLGFNLVPEKTIIKKEKDCFTCDICDFKFTEEATLLKHRKHHKKCETCKLNFQSKAQFANHKCSHMNKKVFICEDCNAKFEVDYEFRAHRRSHTKELNLCNTCGKSFHDSRSLREHIKTHTTVRPFVCMECNMTFSRQKTLMLHARMHSDVRKFSCSICRMTFAQNSGLINHLKEKHDDTFEGDTAMLN